MKLAHSYSAIKDYDNCPRKYNEVRILKKFKQGDTEATLYGTAVHKAFEDFIMLGQDLPPAFAVYRQFVEPLTKIKGEVKCELKMAIRRDFSPCGFFDKDVWFRGIPDFMALNHDTGIARVADYKTGKSSRYADTSQLELLAAMIMAHYPSIHKVKGMLLFVVANATIPAEFTREQLPEIWSKWAGAAGRIESAADTGVFNPKSGPLCKFCPVTSCEYHRE